MEASASRRSSAACPCSHSPSPAVDGVHPPSQGSDAGSRYSLRVSVMPLSCGDPVQP
jgi:hypothetical protein